MVDQHEDVDVPAIRRRRRKWKATILMPAPNLPALARQNDADSSDDEPEERDQRCLRSNATTPRSETHQKLPVLHHHCHDQFVGFGSVSTSRENFPGVSADPAGFPHNLIQGIQLCHNSGRCSEPGPGQIPKASLSFRKSSGNRNSDSKALLPAPSRES